MWLLIAINSIQMIQNTPYETIYVELVIIKYSY